MTTASLVPKLTPRLDYEQMMDQVSYACASATTYGTPILIPGAGVAIPSDSYDAAEEGIYWTKGVFLATLVSGVSASRGDKLYWDVTLYQVNKNGASTLTAGDFELGTAYADGSASGGTVLVDLNDAYPSIDVKTFTALSTTVGQSEDFIDLDATSNAVTAVLPAVASTPIGKRYLFRAKNVSNVVTVDGNASELIGALATFVLRNVGDFILIQNTGSAWIVVETKDINGGCPVSPSIVLTTGALDLGATAADIDKFVRGRWFEHSNSGAVNLTVPTAAQMLAIWNNYRVGMVKDFYIKNLGNNTTTLVTATSVTLTGTATIATGKTGHYKLEITGTSTVTITTLDSAATH